MRQYIWKSYTILWSIAWELKKIQIKRSVRYTVRIRPRYLKRKNSLKKRPKDDKKKSLPLLSALKTQLFKMLTSYTIGALVTCYCSPNSALKTSWRDTDRSSVYIRIFFFYWFDARYCVQAILWLTNSYEKFDK